MRTSPLLLAILLLVPLGNLSSQEQRSVQVGDRVRITHDCGAVAVFSSSRRTDCTDTEATVTAMTGDSIVLVDGRSAQLAVSLSSLTAVQVFAGRTTFNATGGALGLAAGAGLASIGGLASVPVVFLGAVGGALGGGGESALKGAGSGFLVGLIPGVVVGALMGGGTEDEFMSCAGACPIAWSIIVGSVGAGLGAINGALRGSERWEEVGLDRLRVSFAPKRDGFALGMSVVF